MFIFTPVSQLYLDRYVKLISYVKMNPNINGYVENHHIIPRSMGGKEDDNIIKLNARQHFLAHWMLWKAFKNDKVTLGFWMLRYMNNDNQQRYITSREFKTLREDYSKIVSDRFKGKKQSTEHIAKRVALNTGKHRDKIAVDKTALANTGQKRDILVREKMVLAQSKIKKLVCPHCGIHAKPVNAKRWHFDNCRVITNVIRSTGPRNKVKCPHCSKEGGPGTMQRWHFDNCKLNRNII